MQNFDDSFLQLLLVSVLSCHGVSVVSECAALSPSGSCRTSYPLCFDSIIPETPRVIFVQLSWISWCWLTIKSYDESVILQLCSQPRSKIINQDFILRGLASIRGASSRSHPAHYSIKEWVKNLKAVEALEAVSPAHLHPVASRWQCWVKNRLSSCNRILFSLCSRLQPDVSPGAMTTSPLLVFFKPPCRHYQEIYVSLWAQISACEELQAWSHPAHCSAHFMGCLLTHMLGSFYFSLV